MIDMFTNYQNLSDYYIPNNLSANLPQVHSYTKLNPLKESKPYELYNIKNELEGYFWYHGDQVVLDFSIDGELKVETDALIFTTPNEEPNILTPARLGQKSYNIVDHRCWKCISYFNNQYIWEELPDFVYPINATKPVYIDAADYLKDKIITFNIYNFRLESIYSINVPGTPDFRISIDSELSKKLIKGIYYCSLEVSGKDSHQTLFSPEDCKLMVK